MGQMFYQIDEPHTSSFLITLVKTECNFFVRSVETGIGRRTLVVAVISVDTYIFLALSELTCHLQEYRNSYFLFALYHLIVNRPNVQVTTKSLVYQQIKLLGQFQCHVADGSVALQLFLGVQIFPWVSFITTDEYPMRLTIIASGIGVS